MSANEDYLPDPGDHHVTKEQRIAGHIAAMRAAVEGAPDPYQMDARHCRLCGATENIHPFRGSSKLWICDKTHFSSAIESNNQSEQ
jgi:ribosomal protein L37AE/L43A